MEWILNRGAMSEKEAVWNLEVTRPSTPGLRVYITKLENIHFNTGCNVSLDTFLKDRE